MGVGLYMSVGPSMAEHPNTIMYVYLQPSLSFPSCARSLLFSAPWALRLNHLHQFLARQLPAYAQDCTAVYPPKALFLKANAASSASSVSCHYVY